MKSHRFDQPDSALQGLLDSFPEIAAAVESAEARLNASLGRSGLRGHERRQLVSDLMRSFLADELGSLSHVGGDVVTGVRNSIVLYPAGAQGVKIRVLRAPRRGGLPSANSRSRALEFEQRAFDFGAPPAVTLALTWRLTDAGVELELSMPVSAGGRRHGPDRAWTTVVPTHQDVSGVADADDHVDIDHVDDLDIRPRHDERQAADGGDEPA